MIETTRSIHLKRGQRLYLWTLGDIGFGGPRFDEKSFSEDRDYLLHQKERQDLVRIIGLGDYLSQLSPTERAANAAAKGGKGHHEDTLERWDNDTVEQCHRFLKEVEGFEGDFIGLLSGHHLYDFSVRSIWHGINSDEYLCKKLKCEYFGTVSRVRLNFKNLDRKKDIFAHHGYGSGRTKGTKIIKRGRVLEGFRADIVLMGHDNACLAERSQVFQWGHDFKGTTHADDVHIIATGAYEKAYELGQAKGGYVEQGLMSPASLGAAMILLENFNGKLRCRALV